MSNHRGSRRWSAVVLTWLAGSCTPATSPSAGRSGPVAMLAEPALAGVGDVEVVRADRDRLGMVHTRYRQHVDGVPVLGGEGIVHQRADGTFAGWTDHFVRYPRVDTTPSVDARTALTSVLATHDGAPSRTDADLWVYRDGIGSRGGEKVGRDSLVWRVRLWDTDRPDPTMPVVLVDAHSGTEIFRYDNLQTARDRDTYTAKNNTSLPGTFKRGEADLPVGDVPVDSAHDFAGVSYDYYDLLGRDSWDASGATIVSVAHFSVDFQNAFWDGSHVVYGDGGVFMLPLSQALDVVGHEITHAVTERSAGLLYFNEAGGLNEATSDIMGAVVESYNAGWVVDDDTWYVGEDIAKNGLVAFRDMADPPWDGWSIDDYDDYFDGMDPHLSSGLGNKAFTQWVGPDLTIEEAGGIWYRALLYYMTAATDYPEARAATERAATDLYGEDSAELAAVSAGWEVVDVPPSDPVEEFDSDGPIGLSAGASTSFSYTPAADATVVWFTLEGTDPDADLYVSFNKIPNTLVYDCASTSADSYDICIMEPAQVGTYWVKVVAASTFTDVTVRAWQHRTCHDDDGDGSTDCDGDCDEADPTVFPGNAESCNGRDDDCDLVIDEAAVDASTWHADADGDSYGDPAVTSTECTGPDGFVLDATDCDDGNAAVSPSGVEVCNGIDDDCNLQIDGATAPGGQFWHPDFDADGYGDAEVSAQNCGPFFDWILDGSDCDDGAAAVHPGASEVCDPLDVDENCDGAADGADAQLQSSFYVDGDLDGFGSSTVVMSCEDGPGLVANDEDCDDADAGVFPGETETCDGVDEDCDGTADDDAIDAGTWYVDGDQDGFGSDVVEGCVQPEQTSETGGDCDDADSARYPGAAETAGDGVDQDCDGADLPTEEPEPTDPTVPPAEEEDVPDGPAAPPQNDVVAAECGCATRGEPPLAALLALGLIAVRRRRP